jgi:glucosamine--fructose-6-phosphate aminotransferase (isomerizing)
MRREALQSPDCVARFLQLETPRVRQLAQAMQATLGGACLTVARGSSDCAAAYFSCAMAVLNGRLVMSLPPSLVTVYGAPLDLRKAWLVAFSQSGQNPDLLAVAGAVDRHGRQTAAFVNDIASPLAQAVQWPVALHAWPEDAVAATKSVITQFVAGATLAAALGGSDTVSQALLGLPDQLRRSTQVDALKTAGALALANKLFVIGRGLGLPVAQEIALKFKETCGIHAEAISSAELKHGPMEVMDAQSHALVLAPCGPGESEQLDCAAFLKKEGVATYTVGTCQSADIQLVPTWHFILQPVCALAKLYPLVDQVARLRDRNPDTPKRIQKVTHTL